MLGFGGGGCCGDRPGALRMIRQHIAASESLHAVHVCPGHGVQWCLNKEGERGLEVHGDTGLRPAGCASGDPPGGWFNRPAPRHPAKQASGNSRRHHLQTASIPNSCPPLHPPLHVSPPHSPLLATWRRPTAVTPPRRCAAPRPVVAGAAGWAGASNERTRAHECRTCPDGRSSPVRINARCHTSGGLALFYG